jgi:hypothetical protein
MDWLKAGLGPSSSEHEVVSAAAAAGGGGGGGGGAASTHPHRHTHSKAHSSTTTKKQKEASSKNIMKGAHLASAKSAKHVQVNVYAKQMEWWSAHKEAVRVCVRVCMYIHVSSI